MVKTLIAAAGFLGKDEDWSGFFSERSEILTCHPLSFPPSLGFEGFAKKFNQLVEQTTKPPRLLLGYSLGGRQLLQALLANPALYSSAVFISTHFGLSDEKERAARLEKDLLWANKFLKLPWEALMEEWESQPVFDTSRYLLKRQEKDYERQALSDCLQHYSLGKQPYLKDSVEALSLPILWMTGERDEKFTALGRELKFKNPKSQVMTLPLSGHRAPWETPQPFKQAVYNFLAKIS